MEEKKVVGEEQAAAEPETPKKETVREKFSRKKAEFKAKRDAKKGAQADKPKKINVKKIIVGVGAGLAAAAAVGAAIAASKRGETGEIDPDWECEPGDDYPEVDDTSDSEEAATEEVAE